ncbi:phosphoribosylformylglycinamidine synthase subunit PurL [Candidatus Aerophobetes bacterium]|uniref:Phosphoribosylformylglycinamidine synthase subunit PurL n=1 Tax=Aerophobetes bacterium TaxID=2030807 RepID=A0A523TFA7_UNCAE|nr:MAG: phosphoribosylformylglycinamidine synthase subunit PurL [Candidatus Aerophobetes bacterium]
MDLVRAHGLTEEEYKKIKDMLGRDPNFTELGIFSVMWSEHCSYKSSKPLLRMFPTSGENILIKAGEENAGVVDIGEGLAVVMKMESHNHPSAVEPFQGAATGVGGIIRDIFTMGARPIALLDSLRFGHLGNGHNRYLFSGVVGGIAAYGNCMGIPTVGGEVYFDETYEGNPLVNVMCVGVARRDNLVKARAGGLGNPVLYVGADTGRDGLGGASFASRELTEESDKDRPAVQIGDPFKEKLLLEACLELLNTGVVVGMQDMGAAGLTSSTSETASRGNSGMRIDLSLVPRREEGMIPYELMLSESQERMLVIIKRGKERETRRVFDKWDLHAVPIGEVTDDGYLTVLDKDRRVAEIPVKFLTEDAPVYMREEREPEYLGKIKDVSISTIPEPQDYDDVLKILLASPTISSKRWVYEQYDYMIRTDTVLRPGGDAAVIRIKGTEKAIALTCDGNGRYCFLDPYEGGKIAVAEAARNVVCVGAKPLAITNCLNFGNPTKPYVFWQFRRCVEGIADACGILETPVSGGNVSFYNENPKGAIDPTPVVGMLGLIEKMDFLCTPWFKKEGDLIILLGECREEIGGSEYLQLIHGLKAGQIPRLDLERERAVQNTCLEVIRAHLVSSAHDCSEGGLAVTLAECCISNSGKERGAIIELEAFPEILSIRMDALLFGETQSRILISCHPRNFLQIQRVARRNKVPCARLGVVTGDRLTIRRIKKRVLDLSLKELGEKWRKGLSHGDD